MNNEIEDKPKERGHRPKKFGDHESIVASWRVDKDAYKENKTEIRKDVNNVLESYNGNKKMVKKEIPDVVNKPTNNVEDINKLVKTEKKNKEKIFIINQEEYEQRDYLKEFTNREGLEQTEKTKSNRGSFDTPTETKKRDPKEVFSFSFQETLVFFLGSNNAIFCFFR